MGDIGHSVSPGRKANSLEEALLCDIDQSLCFGADLTAGEGCRTIAMKSLVVSAHVNGYDVPFLQDVAIGNSVDHHIVDADAGAAGVAVVMQERRFRALPHDIIVNSLVNRLCRYAGPYHFPCQGTGCRGNFTGLAHRLELMFIFD